MTPPPDEAAQLSFSPRPPGAEHSPHRDRWIIPYADLVTLLLALFIMLYAAADRERARMVAQAVAAQFGESPASAPGNGILPGSDALLDEQAALEKAFAANPTLRERARLTKTERGLVVSLAEAGFFPSGDAVINEDALPLIDALAETLRVSTAPIRVEGHTDSSPIATARYPSNWELSASRASVVLARLMHQGVAPARLSVAGYADMNPIASNETSEGRAQNRRVDIVLLRPNSH